MVAIFTNVLLDRWSYTLASKQEATLWLIYPFLTDSWSSLNGHPQSLVFCIYRVSPLVKVLELMESDAIPGNRLLPLLLRNSLAGGCNTFLLYCIQPQGGALAIF